MIGGKARNRPIGDALLDRGAGRDGRRARQKLFDAVYGIDNGLVAGDDLMIDLIQGLQRVGTVFVRTEAIHRLTHQAKM